jgi:hypothetical protein
MAPKACAFLHDLSNRANLYKRSIYSCLLSRAICKLFASVFDQRFWFEEAQMDAEIVNRLAGEVNVAVAMLLHNKRRCELMTLDESSSNVSND